MKTTPPESQFDFEYVHDHLSRNEGSLSPCAVRRPFVCDLNALCIISEHEPTRYALFGAVALTSILQRGFIGRCFPRIIPLDEHERECWQFHDWLNSAPHHIQRCVSVPTSRPHSGQLFIAALVVIAMDKSPDECPDEHRHERNWHCKESVHFNPPAIRIETVALLSGTSLYGQTVRSIHTSLSTSANDRNTKRSCLPLGVHRSANNLPSSGSFGPDSASSIFPREKYHKDWQQEQEQWSKGQDVANHHLSPT